MLRFYCRVQAHELGASCLTHLAAARQLASLSLEGIPRMGSDGWYSLFKTLTVVHTWNLSLCSSSVNDAFCSHAWQTFGHIICRSQSHDGETFEI